MTCRVLDIFSRLCKTLQFAKIESSLNKRMNFQVCYCFSIVYYLEKKNILMKTQFLSLALTSSNYLTYSCLLYS